MRDLALTVSPFHGRINRRQYGLYWLAGILLFLVDIIALFILSMFNPDGNPLFVTVPVAIFWIYLIIAANVKRLHDRDQTGKLVIGGVLFFPLLAYIVVTNFYTKGTVGENRFDT